MAMNKAVGNYEIRGLIGVGSAGNVYLAMHKLCSRMVALKFVPGQRDDQLMREIEMMKKCRHPNVTEIYETIEKSAGTYIAMELGESGHLGSYVESRPLTESEVKRLFQQMVSGIVHIHEMNIVHRDLKLENVLVSRQGDCRISDFGLSKQIDTPGRHTACGSPAFVAPEVAKREDYSTKADVWSLGVILYFMSVGTLPFTDSSVTGVLRKIIEDPFNIPETMSPVLADLLQKMLEKDPEHRISINEVLSDPWLASGVGSVTRPQMLGPRDFENDMTMRPVVLGATREIGMVDADVIEALQTDPFGETSAVYHILYCEITASPLRRAGSIPLTRSVDPRDMTRNGGVSLSILGPKAPIQAPQGGTAIPRCFSRRGPGIISNGSISGAMKCPGRRVISRLTFGDQPSVVIPATRKLPL